MIKRILDNYFWNILEKHINYIFERYLMNIKFDKRKNCVLLYAKDIRYNENEYKRFGVFHKEKSFDYIIDFKELQKKLIEEIKEYKENNR